MKLLVLLLWGLLLLKICWNVMVPAVLQRRAAKGDEAGISLAPMVEVLVLVFLVSFSALSSEDEWWCHWPTVLGMGLGSIVVSYVLMGVAGFFARPSKETSHG